MIDCPYLQGLCGGRSSRKAVAENVVRMQRAQRQGTAVPRLVVLMAVVLIVGQSVQGMFFPYTCRAKLFVTNAIVVDVGLVVCCGTSKSPRGCAGGSLELHR